ncbi:hypothetical protein HYPSUDRAFT_59887 [Hypholoma sublateritium FD-334 SS-4]|uniref:Uncharacterized protein n=1 Tax=Hypholoma sublateritium (strain FD-334 SS-4) TaxID=945553 RepID=A0A0D2LRL5_HYPSF|nr:hypothetical protein HYPSUDRAFT_59887 [Hypholoma sublateritium FD-334 SS-4]
MYDLRQVISNARAVERYIVNTHAFHNAHRLRKALKQLLVESIPLYPPEVRKEKHLEIAHILQATHKAKSEVRAAQRQRTREAAYPTDSTASRKHTRMQVDEDTQSQIPT